MLPDSSESSISVGCTCSGLEGVGLVCLLWQRGWLRIYSLWFESRSWRFTDLTHSSFLLLNRSLNINVALKINSFITNDKVSNESVQIWWQFLSPTYRYMLNICYIIARLSDLHSKIITGRFCTCIIRWQLLNSLCFRNLQPWIWWQFLSPAYRYMLITRFIKARIVWLWLWKLKSKCDVHVFTTLNTSTFTISAAS